MATVVGVDSLTGYTGTALLGAADGENWLSFVATADGSSLTMYIGVNDWWTSGALNLRLRDASGNLVGSADVTSAQGTGFVGVSIAGTITNGATYMLGFAVDSGYVELNANATTWNINYDTTSTYAAAEDPVASDGTVGHGEFAAYVDGTIGATPPAITDVDTDELVQQGQTNVTITGTDFGATQGGGSVTFSPSDNISDGGAVTQTVTSWADTAIDVTANFPGTVGIGATAYVFVTNDNSDSNATGFQITREAVSATITVSGITGGASLTALEWMVLSSQDLNAATILDQGNGETTDGSGNLVLDVLGSGATNGQSVWYIIKDASETNAAQGPATVVVA